MTQPLYAPNNKTTLRWLRRLSQTLFLALWLGLFVAARGAPEALPELFLMTDPLVAALTMGASRVLVAAMAGAVALVVVTLIFGRVFCGWICPLGTLIDLCARIFRPREDRFSAETHQAMQRWKYYLLALMVVGAIFSAQWVYLLDPLVLLFRGVTAGIYPAVGALLPKGALPESLSLSYFGVAFGPIALLVIVLALTALAPRFYCRYLCPLGAFYGLLSRRPLLRRRANGCDTCAKRGTGMECVSGCRMGAVQKPTWTQNHECIRCFSGRSFCHIEVIEFDWMAPRLEKKDRSLDLGRRAFLVHSAAGAGLAPLVTLSAYHRGEKNSVVRPPRVLEEETFVDQCVRCSMCVQACPTQTLQPTHLEAGAAGFWTPAVTPLVGGCIADCNACSEVCPTEAIPRFTKVEADKWVVKMGTAVLEKNRCISFTDNLPCAKCFEICPTKAFVIEDATAGTPKRPHSVDYARCVGCGLCELECAKIVFGTPALLTFARGRGEPTALPHAPTKSFVVPLR